eukprot:scaffold4927_cov46-Phaeocystis_antarctica.AAC.3
MAGAPRWASEGRHTPHLTKLGKGYEYTEFTIHRVYLKFEARPERHGGRRRVDTHDMSACLRCREAAATAPSSRFANYTLIIGRLRGDLGETSGR